jgi:hypothetical protein
MKYSEAGKGSAPRKGQNNDSYSEGYDRIFGKKKRLQEIEEQELIEQSLEDSDFDNLDDRPY